MAGCTPKRCVAKPRAEFPPAVAIRMLADSAGRLAVRVTPGARVQALEIAGGKLLAKVRAKPEGGKATAATMKLVAQALGIAPSRIELLHGATSRDKLFAIPPIGD